MNEISAIKVGDEVEWTTNIRRGTVQSVGEMSARVCGPDGHFDVPLSALTVIPPLTPEPAVGSVVLDAQGSVWQRRADGWHSSVFPFGGTTWCVVCGPGTPTLLVPQESAL